MLVIVGSLIYDPWQQQITKILPKNFDIFWLLTLFNQLMVNEGE